jgi:hypothetical protein
LSTIKKCDGKNCKSVKNIQTVEVYNGRKFDGYDRYEDSVIYVDLCPECLLKYYNKLQYFIVNNFLFVEEDQEKVVKFNQKYFNHISGF